jgi:Domain of unknown function (DUF6265)
MMIALIAYGLAQAAIPGPTEARPTPALPLWLAGCWMAQEPDGTRTEECWTVPRGTMILGSSHRFAAGRSLSFEHMRIAVANGTLTFMAQPGGSATTRFALSSSATEPGRASLTFENPENDYPQRIRYAQGETGTILTTISQIDGSRSYSWTLRRPERTTP